MSPTTRTLGALTLGTLLTAVACSGGGGSSALPAGPTGGGTASPSATSTPWNPTIQEFALPSGHFPNEITVGADGDLWFTEPQNHLIGRMSTSGTLVAEYPIANSSIATAGIALGSDGNVWFTDTQSNFVAKITTSGAISEINLASNADPTDIINGPDNNLWFPIATGFGKLVPSSTIPTYYTPTMMGQPTTLAIGPDGNIWFAETFNQRIGRISTTGTGFQEFPLATATAQPRSMITGLDGNLWITEGGTPTIGHISQVARFTTAGVETDYQTPNLNAGMAGIISASNGYLYATENRVGNILRINPVSGQMDEISVPAGSQSGPGGITVGPDGNIWFTELGASKIGRLTPP